MRSDGSAAPTCAAVDEHGARRGEQLRERVSDSFAQFEVVVALPGHRHVDVLEAHALHDLLLPRQHAEAKLTGLLWLAQVENALAALLGCKLSDLLLAQLPRKKHIVADLGRTRALHTVVHLRGNVGGDERLELGVLVRSSREPLEHLGVVLADEVPARGAERALERHGCAGSRTLERDPHRGRPQAHLTDQEAGLGTHVEAAEQAVDVLLAGLLVVDGATLVRHAQLRELLVQVHVPVLGRDADVEDGPNAHALLTRGAPG